MDKILIDQLRLEVEKTYGRKILSSADCQQICLDIHQKTKLRLSFNTLRRFFKLMKDPHLASNYTCEVLSQYCGFTSFQDFKKFKANASFERKSTDTKLLDYLVHLFKNTEVSGMHDITYFSLVKQTICYLDRYPDLVDPFQREISKTRNGQDYYFEQFINIDRLNDYYGSGLRYYLCEKKAGDDQLAGHALLCFRGWMSLDDDEVKKYAALMHPYSITAATAPANAARFFASQLYYHEMMGFDKEQVIMKARQCYLNAPPTRHTYSSYYCFEIIMAEALLLTGSYEEALFYLSSLTDKLKLFIPSYIDVALHETIALFKALAYIQTGKKMKAREIFEKISPHKFYFLSKKYLTILYLSLSRNIRNKHVEEEQVKVLIWETGFSRLTKFLEDLHPVKLSYSEVK